MTQKSLPPKGKFLALYLLVLSIGSVHAATIATCIDAATGMITGSNITWTTTTNSGISVGANGLNGSSPGAGPADTITITFSSAVWLTVAPHGSNGSANFSNIPISNTFVADAGTWNYTPGATSPNTAFPSISGSTLQTNNVQWSGPDLHPASSSKWPRAYADWGQFDIYGITSITWTLEQGANGEGFKFIVIPEPSRAILLGFGIACMTLRRRR